MFGDTMGNIDYILAKLESEINCISPIVGYKTETLTGEMSAETMKNLCLEKIRNMRMAQLGGCYTSNSTNR